MSKSFNYDCEDKKVRNACVNFQRRLSILVTLINIHDNLCVGPKTKYDYVKFW